MLLSHVKVAFRNLARNKVYSFINMGGLALGITACILLVIWATDELSYDRFHTHADHIYKVIANFDNSGKHIIWTNTPAPIAAFAKTEVPDIEHAVRIKYDWPSMRNTEKSEILSGVPVGYVDPSFFSVFDFKMLELNGKNPFPDNRSVIISESLAMKIFGQAAATGKSIIVGDKDEFVVRGIMQDMPHNSSIQLQALFPFSILIENFKPGDNWKSLESDWGDYNYDTFLHLAEKAEPANAAQQLTAIHRKNQEGSGVTYTLQPLTMLHLYGPDLSEKGIQIVRIFVIVALIILLIACMNYINLATARATERAKEIGVRKTAGASRQKLVAQFLVESGVTVIVALLLALMTIELIMPLFNELSGKDLRFSIIDNKNWLLVGGVVFITWLIAGSYPAFLLSSFNPIRAISGKRVIGGANSLFRKILVVTQFTLSIGIIAGTLVIQKQMDFIRNQDLGFGKENIFTFALNGDMESHIETIKKELENHPGIARVAVANQKIWQLENTTGDTDWEGKDPDVSMMIKPINVDSDFKDALDLTLLQGRWFSEGRNDSLSFILNETAVAATGLTDPVGKSFSLWGEKGTIIGVVKDFHHASIHQKIEPVILFHWPHWYWMVYVKVNGQDTPGAIKATEKMWKQYNPGYPFQYSFIDASYDAMYRSEQRTGKIFAGFSLFAIAISCLGLFGLATFTASQRTKEIGIRKALGASIKQIVTLLSKDFLKLVAIAFIFSIPVAYFGMQTWLQAFAYRVTMDWTVFGLAGASALIIAFMTMSFQTVKAGMNNPVDALRSE